MWLRLQAAPVRLDGAVGAQLVAWGSSLRQSLTCNAGVCAHRLKHPRIMCVQAASGTMRKFGAGAYREPK